MTRPPDDGSQPSSHHPGPYLTSMRTDREVIVRLNIGIGVRAFDLRAALSTPTAAVGEHFTAVEIDRCHDSTDFAHECKVCRDAGEESHDV